MSSVSVILAITFFVKLFLGAFENKVQSVTLWAGKKLAPIGAEKIKPRGFQDEITPVFQLRVMNFGWVSLGVLLILGTYTAWYLGFVLVLANTILSTIIVEKFFSKKIYFYFILIFNSFQNRILVFNKTNEIERAVAGERLLQEMVLLKRWLLANDPEIPSFLDISRMPVGFLGMGLDFWVKNAQMSGINDLKSLAILVKNRSPWNRLDPEILEIVFRNCNNDLFIGLEFVYISEQFNCVEYNFLKISGKSQNYKDSVESFAFVLHQIGSENLRFFNSEPKVLNPEYLCHLIESAFHSSITCNEYMLLSYTHLIMLYSLCSKGDRAREMYEAFKGKYSELLSKSETEVSPACKAIQSEAEQVKRDLEEFLLGDPFSREWVSKES